MKAKGLLSQMLSLPEDWDYTLAGLSHINREKIDAIREAVRELERAGYIAVSYTHLDVYKRQEQFRCRALDLIFFCRSLFCGCSRLFTCASHFAFRLLAALLCRFQGLQMCIRDRSESAETSNLTSAPLI